MSSDLSGEITAIATAMLAAFAIVTAVFAFLAYRKQSQEVSILVEQDHERLETLKQEADERHREQASRIWVVMAPYNETTKRAFPATWLGDSTADGAASGVALAALVTNASEHQQPIFNTRLHWYHGTETYGPPELIGAVPGYERTGRSRNFPLGTDPSTCGAILTFHDAAGFAWLRTPYGLLTETASGKEDFPAYMEIVSRKR